MYYIYFYENVALASLSLSFSSCFGFWLVAFRDCVSRRWVDGKSNAHTHKKKLWVHRSVLGSIASDQEENRVHKEPKHIDLGLRHVQFGVSLTPKMSPWSKDLSQTQLTETWNG